MKQHPASSIFYDDLPERATGVGDETLLQAVCEECGKTSMFSGKLLGSVQECPFCLKFMDIESAEGHADWNAEWESEGAADDDLEK